MKKGTLIVYKKRSSLDEGNSGYYVLVPSKTWGIWMPESDLITKTEWYAEIGKEELNMRLKVKKEIENQAELH